MERTGLFYRLPQTITSLYRGKSLAWQIFAAALTALIVLSGFDWYYFEATRGIPFALLISGVALGGLVPIIAPLVLLGWSAAQKSAGKSARLAALGWALGQAAILGLAVSSLYKAFTGRMPPPETWRGLADGSKLADISHGFQFGLFRGGIFWGWPSSHTAVAFAMGAALFALIPERRFGRYVGLIWALYVGIAVSASIHWFSEFAAGAIIGSVVGIAVGRSFRGVLEKSA